MPPNAVQPLFAGPSSATIAAPVSGTPPKLTLKMIEHAMDAEFLKTGNPVRHTNFPPPPEPPVQMPASAPAPTQAAA